MDRASTQLRPGCPGAPAAPAREAQPGPGGSGGLSESPPGTGQMGTCNHVQSTETTSFLEHVMLLLAGKVNHDLKQELRQLAHPPR